MRPEDSDVTSSAMLRVEGICKSYSITKALSDVSLSIYPGEVRGLIGENGSGKSTLAGVISGHVWPDSGSMSLRGLPYRPSNPVEATDLRIGMVVQEMATIGELTVAENIFLGRETLFRRKTGIVDTRGMNEAAARILARIGIESIEPASVARDLGFEDRKMVEIARSMHTEPDLLIVDETTTALSQAGREILYRIMDRLRSEGKTVVFISHDLDEVVSRCDSISVMRDGKYIDTLRTADCTHRQIRQLMVGREIGDTYYREDFEPPRTSELALECEGLETAALRNVSLKLHKGEILGIAGLTDCGMHEIGKAAFGLVKLGAGSVHAWSAGRKVDIRRPKTAIAAKIGYVSKNRDIEALMLLSSIRDNIVLPSLGMLERAFLVSPRAEKRFAKKCAQAMQVKMRDINQYASQLSGGNKQKVVLSKWLGNGSDVLILDCPTRGIDIGVKASIYKLMQELRAEGKAILMISEELPEVIGMSDRVLVMKDGAIAREFARSPELSESDIISYMI
jgi:ABC-type sugar transport system, ATPase component